MSPERVLVVAAHPDDEVLGCGGTIARHARDGDDVHIVIVAEGATSREGHAHDATTALRAAANQAARLLGASAVHLLGMPDNRLDSVPLLDIIKLIEPIFVNLQPRVVYTHHPADLNVDHTVVHRATATLARPLPGSSVECLLQFEVASSTGWASPSAGLFVPNWFVDIEQFVDIKRQALEVYADEMRAYPHARSAAALDALGHWRGASVGLPAAEAFELQRRVR
ncbi:MAG: PIG-L deacetylase family protein [Coriobacteriia bacterium]|nr:PIG-L deacetylase family protein [Coriobacteriia bacterium]